VDGWTVDSKGIKWVLEGERWLLGEMGLDKLQYWRDDANLKLRSEEMRFFLGKEDRRKGKNFFGRG